MTLGQAKGLERVNNRREVRKAHPHTEKNAPLLFGKKVLGGKFGMTGGGMGFRFSPTMNGWETEVA